MQNALVCMAHDATTPDHPARSSLPHAPPSCIPCARNATPSCTPLILCAEGEVPLTAACPSLPRSPHRTRHSLPHAPPSLVPVTQRTFLRRVAILWAAFMSSTFVAVASDLSEVALYFIDVG